MAAQRKKGFIAVIGPTHFLLRDFIFLNEFDMLNTNMKVLFIASKYFSRYEYFFVVALKSY